MMVECRQVSSGGNEDEGHGNVMTVEEAAHRIGVSPRTMRRLASQRRIRHVRIGRLVRLYEDDVDNFLARCTVESVG